MRYTMCTLFERLGLPNGTRDVDIFFETHRLRPNLSLQDAPFWTEAQQKFLQEVQDCNGQQTTPPAWGELVVELYARLRH